MRCKAGMLTGRSFGWNVSAAQLSSSFSVSSKETTVSGLFFKQDGTKMYVSGYDSDSVHEYNLPAKWEVSSAVFSQSYATQLQIQTGLFFDFSGTRMYLNSSVSSIRQYSLSAAWDVSTASFVRSYSPTNSVSHVFFRHDGLRMYTTSNLANGSDSWVEQHALSAAWDISTASYVTQFNVHSTALGSSAGLFFKEDGKKMYVGSGAGVSDNVSEYDLASAWDISSASFVDQLQVNVYENSFGGVFFKPDGDRMFIGGSWTDNIRQFDIPLR